MPPFLNSRNGPWAWSAASSAGGSQDDAPASGSAEGLPHHLIRPRWLPVAGVLGGLVERPGQGRQQRFERTEIGGVLGGADRLLDRSEEHTSELQSLMRISYAVFCLKKKKKNTIKIM